MKLKPQITDLIEWLGFEPGPQTYPLDDVLTTAEQRRLKSGDESVVKKHFVDAFDINTTEAYGVRLAPAAMVASDDYSYNSSASEWEVFDDLADAEERVEQLSDVPMAGGLSYASAFAETKGDEAAIWVIVKGTKADAERTASDLGIPLVVTRTLKHEVGGVVPTEYYRQVQDWLHATTDAPYPPGSLLWYRYLTSEEVESEDQRAGERGVKDQILYGGRYVVLVDGGFVGVVQIVDDYSDAIKFRTENDATAEARKWVGRGKIEVIKDYGQDTETIVWPSSASERHIDTTPDEEAVKELVLFIENDGDLYRQLTQPIMKNLARKMVKGTYDRDRAEVGWMYLADAGAKKYTKEFGSSTDVDARGRRNGAYGIFGVPERHAAAVIFARDFEGMVERKEYDVNELAKGR